MKRWWLNSEETNSFVKDVFRCRICSDLRRLGNSHVGWIVWNRNIYVSSYRSFSASSMIITPGDGTTRMVISFRSNMFSRVRHIPHLGKVKLDKVTRNVALSTRDSSMQKNELCVVLAAHQELRSTYQIDSWRRFAVALVKGQVVCGLHTAVENAPQLPCVISNLKRWFHGDLLRYDNNCCTFWLV